MENDYRHTNTTVSLINYHFVFCPRYRRKIFLIPKIEQRFKTLVNDKYEELEIEIIAIECDKDHVHILFKAHPNTELSKFINAYKSASSRLIKKEFPTIRKQLWKEYFWSRSFCLITTGGVPIEVIKKYIENQGK